MLKLSPDEAALLKAVCADRDADLPRLVYADYLDDNGRHERAELIRLQCQPSDPPGVAHEPRQLSDGTWRVAAPAAHRSYRISELLATNRDRWLKELPVWSAGLHAPHFVRGFIEGFEFPVSQFLLYGPQLLDRTPVRWLWLQSVRKLAVRLATCGWLGEVPELAFNDDRLDNRWVVDLCQADWLIHTRRLSLAGNELGDGAATALARCRALHGLELLSLDNNRLTRAGVETLLGSSYLTGCHFRLRGNPRVDADHHSVARLLGPRGTL